MKSLLALFVLSLAPLFAQCTIWNQTACAGVYTLPTPSPTNPSLASFQANTLTSYSTINAQDASSPQPKILMTVQDVPCSGAWLGTNVSGYGPYCTAWMAKAKAPWPNGAGVSTQDINVWDSAFACDPSYAGFSGEGTCDSFTGAAFAYGSAPASGTGANTRAMGLYWTDQAVAYALAHGITLRMGIFPSNNTVGQTTATPPSLCNASLPVTSESVLESCLKPVMQALLTRYGGLISNLALQIVEEPTGGMHAQQIILNVSQYSTFIQNMAAAAVEIDASVQIGAAALGSDSAYWFDWTSNGNPATCLSGTSCFALNFLVLDIFTSNCDNSAATGTSYSATLNDFSGGSPPSSFVPNGAAVGKPMRIGQTDAPIWCQITSPATTPNQATALLGQSDILWQTSNLTVMWLDTMVRWASANGISSFAMFVSTPLFCASTNQASDNGVPNTAFSLACVQNLVPTVVAQEYSQLSLHGPAASEQGY